jgi:hypothetical protein
MISDKKIRKWATTIEAQSTLRIVQFSHRPAIGHYQAKIHIAFENESQEYHVWILPELNLIYLDVFHKPVETDELLFRGKITEHSLDRISQILRPT